MTIRKTRDETVKIAIPATGRMAQECLEWLVAKGAFEQQWTEEAIAAMDSVKKVTAEEPAVKAIQKSWNQGIRGLTLKYDLRSGWRIAFSAKNGMLNGNPVTIYGSDPPTIAGIRQGLAEAAVLGFDDLLAAMVPYFKRGTEPELWQNPLGWKWLNDQIVPNSTDVRVLGATGINDYAGLFILASKMPPSDYFEKIKEGRVPVFVKGRNQGLAYCLLGNDIDARPVEEVEDAVKSEKAYGLDISRSGDTVLKSGLLLVGPCRLYTTPLITVDVGKLKSRPGLSETMLSLLGGDKASDGYYSERINAWERGLSQKLGKQWVHN